MITLKHLFKLQCVQREVLRLRSYLVTPSANFPILQQKLVSSVWSHPINRNYSKYDSESPNRHIVEKGDIVIKRTPRILTTEEKGDFIIKQVPRPIFEELEHNLVDPDMNSKVEEEEQPSEETAEQDEDTEMEPTEPTWTRSENNRQIEEDETYPSRPVSKVQTLAQNPMEILRNDRPRIPPVKEIESVDEVKRTTRSKDASKFERKRNIEHEPKGVDIDQHFVKIDKIAKKLSIPTDIENLPKNEMNDIVNIVKQVKSNINQMSKDQPFDVADIKIKEPITLFHEWYEAALKAHVYQPEVFALATANLKGNPSCRMMTLKEYNKNGFRFLVNSESRKGYELRVNPKCAMTFNWRELKRSVRIEGTISKLSMVDVNKYFKALPYDNQIIKMASKQSYPIPCRNYLLNRCSHFKTQYPASDQIQLPQHWVAYRLKPTSIEFWQGRHDGVHDRIRFRKPYVYEEPDEKLVLSGEDGWFYERIAP